jgi:O-antigen/teichoic acid export membrane protein
MHLHRQALKGASLLSASEFVNQGCSFLRNVILARTLTKADFGVAALLAMVLTLLEMTSKLALGQQVVQSRHGDNPAFVDSVQFTQLAAGVLSAALILILAWPVSHFFSGPRYLPAIMALALIPLVNGCGNLDLFRRARQLGFERLIVADTVPQLATTLAAWPVVHLLPDYRAVVCLMLGKAVLSSALTHCLADRRFHPRFEREWFRESMRFGAPLLLSGVIQFGNFQGDSMVVAARYPLTQLGEFSVAMTMAMTPAFAFMRVSQSLSLPVLAEVQGDPSRLAVRYRRYVESTALLSCCATLAMIFAGEYVVERCFGAKYAGVGTLASWLIAGQALRMIRGATVSAAMARGDTMNMMVCSAWRLCGLPLAIGVGWLHGSLTWFAVTGFAAEVVALTASVARLASRQHLAPGFTVAPALLGLGCVLGAVAGKWALPVPAASPANALLLAPAILLSIGAFALCFPGLRSTATGFAARMRATSDVRSERSARPPAAVPLGGTKGTP